MAKHWKEDQIYLLEAITAYREKLKGKDLSNAKKITREFAVELHHNTFELHHRTSNSIAERLPYLDNLLAGAFEIQHYALKDQPLYFTQPRPDEDRHPNMCNTRHAYNGAIHNNE